jgi:hypothetical protein
MFAFPSVCHNHWVMAGQAIEERLQQRRKAEVDRAIKAYAEEMAGTGVDLDPALEAASLECLAESERTSRLTPPL